MEEKKFWTAKDVRHEVYGDQICLATIMKLIRKGEIPSTKLGRRIFIPGAWVKQQLNYANVTTTANA